jgi:hypothetical protein
LLVSGCISSLGRASHRRRHGDADMAGQAAECEERFSDSRITGSFIILTRGRSTGRRAVLTKLVLGRGPFQAALEQRSGVFELSLPATARRVTICPQLQTVTVSTRARQRSIPSHDRAAIARLDHLLRGDNTWTRRSYAFFLAAVRSMAEIERTRDVQFELLDNLATSRLELRDGLARSDPNNQERQGGSGSRSGASWTACRTAKRALTGGRCGSTRTVSQNARSSARRAAAESFPDD